MKFILLELIHKNAYGAETLPSISPPTDWTGVIVVCVVAILAVAVAAYIVHIKRTPGLQLGEEQLERLADLLHQKQHPTATIAATALTYDGITFADEKSLADYRAAKAVIESFKKEPTP